MQGAGLEGYTLHEHTLPCNEIVRDFYENLQLVMGDQPTYFIVKGSEVLFTGEEILQAILILDEIPSGSRMFRELCTNINNYAFNESHFKVS